MSSVNLPYTIPISVMEGTAITVKGRVTDNPHRFGLNLFTTDDDQNVALHFSIRFDGRVFVINSKENGAWAREEKPKGFLFERGEEFVLSVTTAADSYLIKVNGEYFHSFCHRVPFSSIKRLGIFEDPRDCSSVSINDVSVKVNLPYTIPISVMEGTAITVKGRVSDNPHRFGLNLFTTDDDRNVALHFSIQFDGSVFVINSKENGTWASEERPTEFLFAKGEEFVLSVATAADSYLIEANGEYFHSFRHRLPFSSVKRLGIFEDPRDCSSVSISDVSVKIDAIDARKVLLESMNCISCYLKVKKNGEVGTTSNKNKKAQFKLWNKTYPYVSLQNVKFPNRYLAVKSDWTKPGTMVVTGSQTPTFIKFKLSVHDGCMTLESGKLIGVETDGTPTLVPAPTTSDIPPVAMLIRVLVPP